MSFAILMRNRSTRAAARMLLLASIALSGIAGAAEHEGHGHGGAKREAVEQHASAVFDAGGKLWAVHRDAGRIVVSGSTDLGRTWDPPVRVTPAPEALDGGGDARPKIAAGPGGELYVTWTRPLAQPYTGEIRLSRSLDGGATFAPSSVVHADRQQITHRFDSVAVDAAGRVFVAWIDKRDLEKTRGAKPPYRGAAVYWAVSDDRGASFRGDYKLADHSCECCRIALAPRADGGFHAFWRHVFEPNVRDHALGVLSPDGRAQPIVRATFDDWRIDVCPHHGGSLARDANNGLHAVWFTGAGEGGVFYGRLAGGKVVGQRRVGGHSAEHADIASSGNALAIAWKEFDGRQSRLKALRSDDAGITWRESELAATSGASGQPQVLVRGTGFYVFWNRRDAPLSVVELP